MEGKEKADHFRSLSMVTFAGTQSRVHRGHRLNHVSVSCPWISLFAVLIARNSFSKETHTAVLESLLDSALSETANIKSPKKNRGYITVLHNRINGI